MSESYFYTLGCEENEPKALYWCEKAAEQNYLPALETCHTMYENGFGCTADPQKAAYWKERYKQELAAHPEWKSRKFTTHTRKAVMEDYNKYGVIPTLPKAAKATSKPEEKPAPASAPAAKPIKKPAPKPEKRPTPAAKPVKKTAPTPPPKPKPVSKPAYTTEIKTDEIGIDGMFEFLDADNHYKNGNYAEAYRLMERAAEAGNKKALFAFATMHENGKGCPVDEKKALYWYEKAAKLNDRAAQFRCGWFYFKGIGCQKDEQKAIFWMEKSAEQGYADAQFVCGVMYFNGNGCTANPEKGIAWVKKAAAQNHPDAIRQLKKLYP
ncbi:MAG: sel1 repeat family protein [Clostridia bacterium]|nr:sel1 repeat family protein [Clostridia bacterium]